LRAKLVEDGQSLPAHIAMVDSFRKEGNTMALPRAERGNWAKDLDVKRIGKDKAEVLFFAGCRYSYDPDLQQVAQERSNTPEKFRS